MLLDGVGTGFIQRIDPAQVLPDLVICETAEGYSGALGEEHLALRSPVQETNSSHDQVSAPLQLSKHFSGGRLRCWLAQECFLQGNQGVCCQHQGVGNFPSYPARFAEGIDPAQLAGAQLCMMGFRRIGGLILEREAQ